MLFRLIDFPAIFAPFSAIFLFMLASGFCNTLVSVQLVEIGAGKWMLGFVSTAYYLGITLGSFSLSSLIINIGHIRAFSICAATSAICALLTAIFVDSYLWVILRLVTGISIAGIYIVIESWFLNLSESNNRGKYLAIYMFGIYSSSAIGQLAIEYLEQYLLLSMALVAIFISMSIIPLAATNTRIPQIESPEIFDIKQLFTINAAAVFCCFAIGIILSIVYSVFPYYLEVYGSGDHTGLVMFSIIIGGSILQFPVGYISDLIDRRVVLFVAFVCIILLSINIMTISQDNNLFIILSFIFGGVAFSIYPTSMTHACDYINNDNIITVTQWLVLSYSVGNVVGPIIASSFIAFFPQQGMFLVFISVATITTVFLVYRMFKFDRVPKQFKTNFVATTRTTPIVSELDPRSAEGNNCEKSQNIH